MKTFLLPLCVSLMVCGAALAADGDEEHYTIRQMEAHLEAAKLFPDSDKPGTPLHTGIQRMRAWYMQNNIRYFDNPRWPVLLASAVRDRLNKQAATETATAAPVERKQDYVPPTHKAKEYALRNDPEGLAAYRAEKARKAELRALQDIADELRRLQR